MATILVYSAYIGEKAMTDQPDLDLGPIEKRNRVRFSADIDIEKLIIEVKRLRAELEAAKARINL